MCVLIKKDMVLELFLMPFILLQGMLFSPCSLVRTKFPNRVINGVSHELVGMQNKNGKYYTFDRANIGAGPLWRAPIAVGGACPQCGQGAFRPAPGTAKRSM